MPGASSFVDIVAARRRQQSLARLLALVRGCRQCEAELPLGPRPILRANAAARLLIVGQAPGPHAHQTGISWNDASGDRLRQWMGLDRSQFYDELRIAIIPIGYCYPGRGKSGDLPPRAECARLWLDQLLAHLPEIKLSLLIGRYAHAHFLGSRQKTSLTETVRAWRDFLPSYFPLPHPSGRNNGWFERNAWFEADVIPALRRACQRLTKH
jgi:uracil-DNA glycosylase